MRACPARSRSAGGLSGAGVGGVAVEIDGAVHEDPDAAKHDAERTKLLSRHGITLLRFRNKRVLEDLPEVLEEIWRALEDPPSSLSLLPALAGRRELPRPPSPGPHPTLSQPVCTVGFYKEMTDCCKWTAAGRGGNAKTTFSQPSPPAPPVTLFRDKLSQPVCTKCLNKKIAV